MSSRRSSRFRDTAIPRFRQFLSYEFGRFHHVSQFAHSLFGGPCLQAAVRGDEDLFCRNHTEGATDAVRDLLHGLYAMRVRIHHAQADVLCERRFLECLQQCKLLILERQVELIDGEFEHRGIDLGHVTVADVAHGVGAHPVGNDFHRFYCEVEVFLRPRVDSRLIDLNVSGSRALQIHDLLMNRAGEFQDEFPASRVVFVERPLRNRVRAGQHSFHGLAGEGLRVLEPLHRHRVAAPHRPDDYRFGIVPVPVRADETGDGKPFHRVGEVGDHISAVLLAVHEEVHAGVFLDLNPFTRCAALQFREFFLGEVLAEKLAPRFEQMGGFRVAADRSGWEQREAHACTPFRAWLAARVPSTSRWSFRFATPCGKNSSPALGATITRSGGTTPVMRRMACPISSTVSSRVFRASRMPHINVLVNGARAMTSQLRYPATKSSPITSNGSCSSCGYTPSTSPKYVQRTFLVFTPSTSTVMASANKGYSCLCRHRAGSSTWMISAPAFCSARSSALRARASARTNSRPD